MENNQVAYLSGEIQYSKEQIAEIKEDYFWKALYSHSYTILFKCENCDHEFDVDGWFYLFEAKTCPKCKTNYSGVFGKVFHQTNDRLKLETFEGQEIEILLPSGSRLQMDSLNHIVLVIFSKSPDRQGKPWGLIDYAERKPEIKFFKPVGDSGKNGKQKNIDGKRKSILAYLLFGALSVLGIFGVIVFVFPKSYHF